MADTSKLISPYRRGADYGALMGLYLSAALCAVPACIYPGTLWAYVSLAGDLMLLLTPLLLYWQFKRGISKGQTLGSFWELFAEGVMTFICASVITAIVGYVYMRFLNPTFIPDFFNWTMTNLQEMAKLAPDAETAEQYEAYSRSFKLLAERGELPSPIDFQLNAVWFTAFAGCMLSLVMSGIMGRTPKNSLLS